MGFMSQVRAVIGAGSQPRPVKRATESSMVSDLASIFGEANPAQVSSTPRGVGVVPTPGENIRAKPLVVANGWIDRPSQTKGMSVLMVDQFTRMPDAAVQGTVASAINQSRYVPSNHNRFHSWLYSGWDPIYRYANTYMDLRWSSTPREVLTNAAPGNLPGGPRTTAQPQYRYAWNVPRFSTEPYTIIPQPSQQR